MSNAALAWARALDLPMTRKAVLIALADRADHDGICWPSNARIQADTGASEQTVRRALRDLEAAGAITTEARIGPDGKPLSHKITLRVGATVVGSRCHGGRGVGATVAPETKERTHIEPDIHRARADGLRSLPDLIAEAGGVALNPTCPATMILSPVHGWLASGADLDLDILPTIRAIAATASPHSIRTLTYFAGPVAKARDARLAGLPTVRATGPPRDRREPRTSATELALKRIKARAYGDT